MADVKGVVLSESFAISVELNPSMVNFLKDLFQDGLKLCMYGYINCLQYQPSAVFNFT
ncbi:hypothetical protein JVT61DRAFT_6383 [Boletus reticuloceps]|uniref:Uncharacterized protein n=1 Tax=Boletus reticuloceps TaxID=495285 RepID=A0A8I2YKV1_9AGAM|nr:hypothetical protein JVT61DRAFT_6383 [Boletus reticuloceps]